MKNDTTKRNQRTPEELILETQAKLERLRLKQAKEVAQTDPEIAALNAERASYQKEMSRARTLLGDGPQSGSARIAKHEVWIEKIEAEMRAAEYLLENCTQSIEEIDSKIASKISQLSA
jgi:capsule polysaccharide export protein KpsE/RkpR